MARAWEYGQLYESNPEVFGGRPKAGINLLKINKAGEEGWELVGQHALHDRPGGSPRGVLPVQAPRGVGVPALRAALAAAGAAGGRGCRARRRGRRRPPRRRPAEAAAAAAAAARRVDAGLPRRCGVCHLDKAPPGAPGLIVFARPGGAGAAGAAGMCYSCHNGIVDDRRRWLGAGRHHPASGKISCGSCHTPHVQEANVGTFMRFPRGSFGWLRLLPPRPAQRGSGRAPGRRRGEGPAAGLRRLPSSARRPGRGAPPCRERRVALRPLSRREPEPPGPGARHGDPRHRQVGPALPRVPPRPPDGRRARAAREDGFRGQALPAVPRRVVLARCWRGEPPGVSRGGDVSLLPSHAQRRAPGRTPRPSRGRVGRGGGDLPPLPRRPRGVPRGRRRLEPPPGRQHRRRRAQPRLAPGELRRLLRTRREDDLPLLPPLPPRPAGHAAAGHRQAGPLPLLPPRPEFARPGAGGARRAPGGRAPAQRPDRCRISQRRRRDRAKRGTHLRHLPPRPPGAGRDAGAGAPARVLLVPALPLGGSGRRLDAARRSPRAGDPGVVGRRRALRRLSRRARLARAAGRAGGRGGRVDRADLSFLPRRQRRGDVPGCDEPSPRRFAGAREEHRRAAPVLDRRAGSPGRGRSPARPVTTPTGPARAAISCGSAPPAARASCASLATRRRRRSSGPGTT